MELYLIRPENKEYIAGKAQYPASISRPDGCSVLFLPLLLVVFALLPLGFGLNMLRENILLSSESVTVQGRIINRYIDEDDDGTTYHVVFEYVANDRRYERRQQVGESKYSRYERGLIVDVEYSASDPSVARLAGTNTWFFTFFLLGFAVLWMLFSGFFLTRMVNENRKLRAQLTRGKLLKGKLLELSAEEGEDSDGDKFIRTTARVAFRAPDGRVVRGERSRVKYGDKLPTLPAKDTLASFYVAIFYMDDDHWEVL